LYLGTTDAVVAAVDVDDQRIAWQTDVYKPLVHPIAVDGFSLYAAVEGGELHALDAPNGGTLQWRQKLSGYATAAPAVDDMHVYVGTNGGVDALDSNRAGAIQWTNEAAKSMGHLALVDDTIYATSGDKVTATPRFSDESDDESTDWQVDANCYCPPAVAGDTLYVGDEQGGVNAFTLDGGLLSGLGGRREWRHEHGDRVRHVVVTDGRVYGATEPSDGESMLFALE
jgi:outer membrane protein assembly factor BamB